jgi:hypothetical protein
MSLRTAAWLAWSVWGIAVGLVALSVPLTVLNRFELGFDWAFTTVVAVAFSSVGAIVASRRPENALGWIFCVIGLSDGVLALSTQYGLYGSITNPGALPGASQVVGATFGLAGVGFGLFVTFALLLFPDGRLPSRRWRPVAWMSALGVALISTGVGFGAMQAGGREVLISLTRRVQPPLGGFAETLNNIGHLLVFLGLAAGVVSLFVRRRRASQAERQQLKWFAYGAATFALAILSYALPWDETISEVLELATTAFIPVAVGVAILRYGLYEIDLIINRTLVYGALTATLAAVYFGGVTATQAIFRILTGQEQQPQLAIVVSTLVIAALFNPLRRRIQSFIDRRFYRRKYDAAKTLEAFSAKLRDETNLDALNAELVSVVRETMQPAHVSLWLRPDTASKKDEASG